VAAIVAAAEGSGRSTRRQPYSSCKNAYLWFMALTQSHKQRLFWKLEVFNSVWLARSSKLGVSDQVGQTHHQPPATSRVYL
jgi:hypothetical protein